MSTLYYALYAYQKLAKVFTYDKTFATWTNLEINLVMIF